MRDLTPSAPADTSSPLVSVLIPVLDEERELPSLLDALLLLPGRWEVIVCDGGSSDATLSIADRHPLAPLTIAAGGGRPAQLNAAGAAASGDVLVFLHADSRLPRDAYASLAAAWRTAGVVGGNFRLRFDGGGLFERVLGAVYALQRRHGYYYGDSSVWARRDTFDALGGYRALAIMDDYDFVRRLERAGRTLCLPGPALTSARRWRAMGITRTVSSWFAIRWLYLAGIPPGRLIHLYRRVR